MRMYVFNLCMHACISVWIFQKVLAEIVQKALILSQKRLISNHRNFGLLAPESMRFPSIERLKIERSFFLIAETFYALETLYCNVILTSSSGQFLFYFFKKERREFHLLFLVSQGFCPPVIPPPLAKSLGISPSLRAPL